jgi:hypothetical protein
MKTLSKLLLVSIIGFFLSCNNAGIIPTEPIQTNEADYIVDFYQPEFLYTSVDELIQVKEIDSTAKIGMRSPFFSLLGRLNLDSLQRIKAHRLFNVHQECVKSCISELKSKQLEITNASKLEFAKIRSELNSGIITKSEAREQMKLLNEKTKEQIIRLAKTLKVKECVQECDTNFIKSLTLILNEKQIETLNLWLNKKSPKLDSIKVKRDSIGIKKDSIRIKRDTIGIKKDSIRIKKDSIIIKRDSTDKVGKGRKKG